MKFRKRPAVIEAVLWQGGNLGEILDFVKPNPNVHVLDYQIFIPTLEGIMRADEGDWIIRDVKGELYPCKPDIFRVIYEKAE